MSEKQSRKKWEFAEEAERDNGNYMIFEIPEVK